jgi:hypothetical protein
MLREKGENAMTRKEVERQEAITRLKEMVKPGDTLHTIVRHVSRSGMSRVIDVYKLVDGDALRLSWSVADAIGEPYDRKNEGVRVGGCGMDMGFHVVYNLSRVLFPDGFDCIGEKCPSNDHSNAYYYKKEGKEVPKHHADGGYALRQRWI